MSQTLRGLWLKARAELAMLPADEAERDARLLIQAALRLTPAQFLSEQRQPAPQDGLDHLAWMLQKRAQRMPVSHILGEAAFYGRLFDVTKDTLAPRADSELIITTAMEAPFERLLDLGTGTGCLAITLLAERPEAHGIATDISPEALAVATRNAARHGVADRLELIETVWDDGIDGQVELIVCNPPYISAPEMEALDTEVRSYEPRIALTPGETGLEAYRELAPRLLSRLTPGGRAVFEIGHLQGAPVKACLETAGLEEVQIRQDLSGKDRVVAGKAPILRL